MDRVRDAYRISNRELLNSQIGELFGQRHHTVFRHLSFEWAAEGGTNRGRARRLGIFRQADHLFEHGQGFFGGRVLVFEAERIARHNHKIDTSPS